MLGKFCIVLDIRCVDIFIVSFLGVNLYMRVSYICVGDFSNMMKIKIIW